MREVRLCCKYCLFVVYPLMLGGAVAGDVGGRRGALVGLGARQGGHGAPVLLPVGLAGPSLQSGVSLQRFY